MKNTNSNKIEKLKKKIKKVSKGYCAMCATLEELEQLHRNDFVLIIKEMYKVIDNRQLNSSRVKSWKDEFKEIKCKMIPIIKTKRKANMKIHFIFEMRFPQSRTNPNLNDPIFCDVIVVSDDSYAVLEFKQRKADVIKVFYKQLDKYNKRLHWHKAARHLKNRYMYMVCTKETVDGIGTYKNVKYGNSKSVATDMLNGIFKKAKPYEDIESFLKADFKPKKGRKNNGKRIK